MEAETGALPPRLRHHLGQIFTQCGQCLDEHRIGDNDAEVIPGLLLLPGGLQLPDRRTFPQDSRFREGKGKVQGEKACFS